MTDGTAEVREAGAPQRWGSEDAVELARLQLEVLTGLADAEGRGDEREVERAHAMLDRVMADAARVEGMRRGREPGTEAAAAVDELSCAGCGAPAQPRYETPRLLGYDCQQCGWKSHDPGARAERKLAEAKDATSKQVGKAVPALRAALPELRGRKKQREHGAGEVSAVLEALDEARRRVEKAHAERQKAN